MLVLNILELPKLLCLTRKFTALDETFMVFSDRSIRVTLFSEDRKMTTFESGKPLTLKISRLQLDTQFPVLAPVLNSTLLAIPSHLEHLYLHSTISSPSPRRILNNVRWLGLFHSFSHVKNLYLSERITPFVAPALHELSRERASEVLPELQNLVFDECHVSKTVEGAIRDFVSIRHLSGHPVAIHHRNWRE
jgi:hypothetical protein